MFETASLSHFMVTIWTYLNQGFIKIKVENQFYEVSNYTFELNVCQCVSLSRKKHLKKIDRGIPQVNKIISGEPTIGPKDQ